jgi:PAS domain S-box-containing protein
VGSNPTPAALIEPKPASLSPEAARRRGASIVGRLCHSVQRGRIDVVSNFESIAPEIPGAIRRLRVPAYFIDPHGIIRWLNPAAETIVGDVRGRHLTSVVAPEESRRAQEIFARNLLGTSAGSDNEAVVIGADGERVTIEVSAVPLQSGGQVIGVFGQLLDVEDDEPPPHDPRLTPRQSEVFRLLQRGRSTEQIADELHLSVETVRNHIQGVLRALNVHSRLEAVANAHGSIATG